MLVSGLLSLFSLTSCLPATTVPINTVYFERSQTVQRHTLVVFLPGRGSGVSSFGEEGLVQELRRKRPELDMIGVEAHLGYYADRTLPVRLKEDVITPAKKLGYDDIWLVGISMGGLGAVLYDTAYPGDITGICLLSPYLGEGSIMQEITRAGGLAAWQPGAGQHLDQEREIWLKLKAYADNKKSDSRVYLGYGTDDRFAETNGFFGQLLPAGQVVTAKGGHDWPTWRNLWDRMLEHTTFLGAGVPAEVRHDKSRDGNSSKR
jgi:pimeloyl-ACP methyl ester carboxylesterase